MSMANVPLSNWAFILANENFVIRLDYDTNDNLIYQGWAQPGSLTSDPTWRIKKFGYSASGLLAGTAFPEIGTQPSGAFSFIWDNRTLYTYDISSATSTSLFLLEDGVSHFLFENGFDRLALEG